MGKKALKYFMLLGLTLFLTVNAIAQYVDQVGDPVKNNPNDNNVGWIDAYATSISWTLSIPVSAGLPVQSVSNDALFLRTSVYTTSWWFWTYHYYLESEIVSGTPPGMALSATSASCVSGSGTRGTPVGMVTLSGSYQTLVSTIETSYSGTGFQDGYQITFTLSPSDYGQIVAGTYNVTVQFHMRNALFN